MRTYETYNPEIDYTEETPVVEGINNDAPKTPARGKKRKPAKKDASAPDETEQKRKGPSAGSKIAAWFKSTQVKILCGLMLLLLAVYLSVTFCGYFSTCIQDQSTISSMPVGQALNVANPGGEGGARLSELLINQGFGLGSLVIIVWLGALGLRLLTGRPKLRPLDFTIKCLVALITVSLIIGLVTYNLHTQVNWGGYHGTYVNEFIIGFIGNIGAVLLSIFMIALFVMICLRDLVNWIIRYRRARAEKRRIANEEKAARLAREEEIRRLQEQEKIDDLKAGEAAVIGNTVMEEMQQEDKNFDFSDETETLYEIGQGEEESQLMERTEEFPVEEKPEEASAEQPDASGEEEPAAEENAETAEEEKMVVNVNTIGQAGNKRFVSDVEAFEKQKYKFPPFDLLKPGSAQVNLDAEEQMENKQRITQTLLDFGIPITRIEATVGPTVTLYEIVPENGVKISKIRNLVDDIALSLAATGVRIIAPIPGKGTVGIEVANKEAQTVSMRTVIQSKKYQESRYKLPIALGSTISNDVYIADLAKMPHLLVAGATGQGKSVGLNAIIASLLYCKAPHEIKFVMIDPKQVEFSLYNKLKNYYMAMIPGDDEPVITDMDKVEATLNSLVIEMESRYSLLKTAHVRNVEEYNEKIRAAQLNPAEGHRFMPYIVVVVDEFGDLIMVKGKSVEMPIARLAQKARAVGMHVIIATQRPSTDVITGIIKANFPARLSFKVSSGVDSKTILDTPGAEKLIGRGDMLIFNSSEMVRVQCAFIDTPEVEAICDYVERQPYPQGIYELPEPMIAGGEAAGDKDQIGERDPRLVEIARAVVSSGKASTSAVQRTFGIGYNRAGRIMDQLEKLGVVGPSEGGKPRALLVDPMGLEEILATLD